jgi:PAS domain S-box-containing protein
MKVDFLTLFLVLGLTDILQAIAISLQYISQKNQKEVRLWAFGFACVAIGFVLLFFRAQIPFLFISIILANAFFNLGALLIYIGIVRFLRQKENKQFLLGVVVIFFLSFFYYTYHKPDINIRTIITSCLVALMSLLTAHALFTKKTKEINLSATFLATVFSIHGLFYIVRTIINLTVSPVHELLNPASIQTVTFLVQITEGILVTFGLIIMVNQRAHSETEEAKNHFELIFSTTPDAVLISSITDGKIIEINDAFTLLSGYSREELIGSSTLATNIWKNPEDRQKVVLALQKEGYCENMQAVYQRKDGVEVFGSLSAKLISLKGTPHIFSITRDITSLKKSQEELMESEEKYRFLHESAGIGIGYYKPDGTVISYNLLAAQNMGGNPEDFNGKSIFQLFPKQEADFYLGRITKAVGEEKPMIYEDLVSLPGGDKYFLSTFTTIKDARKNVLGVQIISQDITDLKKDQELLRQSEEKLKAAYNENQTILDSISDAFFTLTNHMVVTRFNKEAELALGKNKEDVIGRRLFDAFPEARGSIFEEKYSFAIKEKQSLTFETYFGIAPYVNWYNVRVYWHAEGISVFFQLITERKLAENEIKELNEQLEEKVKYRTLELETSNQELEAFAYSVAHDLRAPLRAIDGFSQMLFDEYLTKLDEEAIRKLTIIRSNTHKMDHLILDLLAMARVTTTILSKENLNMNIILESVLYELSKSIGIEKIEIDSEPLPYAMGDDSLIKMVWTNLLENAIKFSRSKEVRKINIQGHQEDVYSIYKITDTGIGFNPKYSSNLFKPFHTLHSPGEFPENTGIGLAIVERIIHRHGGKVWAEGVEGVGATFYFSLPKLPNIE